MNLSSKIKINIIYTINVVLFLTFIYLFNIDFDDKFIILPSIGILSIFIILFGLGKNSSEIKKDEIKRGLYVFTAFIETSIVIYSIFYFWDFFITSFIILIVVSQWMAYLSTIDHLWEQLVRFNIKFVKICALFLIIFIPAYFIYVPVKLYILHATPVWDMVFDLLFSFTIWALAIAMLVSRKYRYNVVFSLLEYVVWFIFPGDWMIEKYVPSSRAFPIAYIFIVSIAFIFVVNSGIGFGRWIGEAVRLRKKKHSVLLGPLFKNVFNVFNFRSFSKEIKGNLKRGAKIGTILMLIALPGILIQAEVFQPTVTINPKNHHIRFNFWAGVNVEDYSAAEIAAFNKHRVNLDLASYITVENIGYLINLEEAMPNITYRLTICQSEIALMPARVREITELMLAYEVNGTLDQWLGFAFDIEGHCYNWFGSFDDPLKSVDVWEEVFDYLDTKSVERGTAIETECVSSYEYSVDEKFDDDLDLQIIEGQIGYNSRFTSYAPMMYRCWPSGEMPYGSPEQPFDEDWRWGTSYMIYSRLQTMNSYVSGEKMGVYLGITNTSCYGRDMPQKEPISWGESTGMDNMIRDILIAKHFGILEVTFFLQHDYMENEMWFGGFISSYGNDSLDRIDKVVNQNPPESFEIYYDHSDAKLSEDVSRDYMCNFNRLSINYLIILLWGAIIIFEMRRKSKDLPKDKKISVNNNNE
jgi:hypothetical protein